VAGVLVVRGVILHGHPAGGMRRVRGVHGLRPGRGVVRWRVVLSVRIVRGSVVRPAAGADGVRRRIAGMGSVAVVSAAAHVPVPACGVEVAIATSEPTT
jgi:hypothetical protein